jgi:hypothetical protein
LRSLIDKALKWGYVLSPLAAPHHRREGLVFVWPSVKGKQKWPSPGGGRGHPSLPYEQVSAAGADMTGLSTPRGGVLAPTPEMSVAEAEKDSRDILRALSARRSRC